MSQSVGPRKSHLRHRLRKILVGLVLATLALVAGLPTLSGLPPIRGLLLSRINGRLAPTQVELHSLQLSWFSPAMLTGLILRDAQGKVLVSAPEATFDRSLSQILLQGPGQATLTLSGAAIDIERSSDGSIDLMKAFERFLGSPAHPGEPPAEPRESGTEFTFRIQRGSLRVATPELAEPLTAERFDLTLYVPAERKPLTWKMALANPSRAGNEAIEINGHFDPRAASGTSTELALSLTGHRWPLVSVFGGIVGRGRLDGLISARQDGGVWSFTGDAKVLDLVAMGPVLAGDRVALDQVGASWDLASVDGGWAVRKLDVSTSLGSIKASGTLVSGPSMSGRLDACVDLVALAKQAPHALHLRDGLTLDKGDIRLRGEVRNEKAGPFLELDARVSELSAHDKDRAIVLRTPAILSARLPLTAALGVRASAGTVELKSAFLDLKGAGDIEHGGKLAGVIDLAQLQDELHQLVDFGGLALSGKASIAAAYHRQPEKVTGQLAVQVLRPKLAGLTAIPFEREMLRLDFAAVGPDDAAGLASSWHTAWLDVKTDDLTAKLEASRKPNDPSIALKASASGVLAVSSLMGQADGRMVGHWDGKALALDEAHGAFCPPAPANTEAGVLRLTASGQFDPSQGILHLTPKTKPEDSLLIAPEGLRVTGMAGSSAALSVEGGLNGDIATIDRALAGLTGVTPYLVAGISAIRGSAKLDRATGLVTFDAKLDSPDLSTQGVAGQQRRPQGPIGLVAKGTYAIPLDRLDLADLALGSRYGTFKAVGSITEATARPVADLRVAASPSWDDVKTLALGKVAPDVMIAGEVQPFQIQGPLSGPSAVEILRGLETELRVNLGVVRAFGLHTDPTPLVVRCAGHQIVIEPLSTGINGGRLELKPEMILDDPKGPALRLARGSEIRELEIDDEVSRRLLAYFVPVLNNSSKVRGHLTATIDRSEFPLAGDSSRSMSAAGSLVFKELTYGPGTFGQQLAKIAGRSKATDVRLNQTIAFEVLNGRVKQQGLKIPVAPGAQVELAGSVGFDSTLQLVATVPITKAMLGVKGQAGGQLVGDSKINLPIGGTLSKPTIERKALQVGLREAGRALLRDGTAAEAIKRIPLPEGADSDAIRNELQNLFKARPKSR